MGLRHGDPLGVVRLGCLGGRAWQVVKGVAESIGGVVGDAPVVEVPVRVDDEAVTERVPLQDDTYYRAPEDIELAVTDESGWDLLADEDDIWQEPSRQTMAHLRRLLGG
jgi:hypothetical protein